ncbi:MAG: sigma-70 family RNA polymerase sigma factor [Anaerolineae bacterium]|nr:sigma-70 family RNA polymerase sigma factor [Anaerolineae bacterium]
MTAAPPSQAEIDLIIRAQEGDKAAFAALIRCHQESVVGMIYRLCGDMATAEDAAQEAFIRAWQALPRYKPQGAFRSWLYRIAYNAAMDMVRRDPQSVDIESVVLAAPERGPEVAVTRKEAGEAVREAVLALPTASRAVLILREYEGLSYQEIAAALDIPVGTVMSRLNYARSRLRELLVGYREAA